MKFTETKLAGVFLLEQERHEDERGWFARTWCVNELRDHGVDPELAQCSASFNKRRGTLRGMHWQAAPHEESKLVRCTRGRIFDVALDMRDDSPTRRQWFGAELSPDNGRALFIPGGCGHGFQTLEPDTEIEYMISSFYQPESARGARWNDPAFAIEWPEPENAHLSERDANYPDFEC